MQNHGTTVVDPEVDDAYNPGVRVEQRTRPQLAATRVGEDTMTVKDRVRWGPIMAGLLTTIATMLVLTVLGLAIGISAFEPGNTDGLGTAAGIWGAISAIIAFFVGGWVAAKTAAVGGDGSGLLNGLMVGVTALALILWLTGSGLGNLLGTVGSNLGDIANIVQDQGSQQDAQQALNDSYGEAERGAWGTLIGLLLALGASAFGGLLGANTRRELIAGNG